MNWPYQRQKTISFFLTSLADDAYVISTGQGSKLEIAAIVEDGDKDVRATHIGDVLHAQVDLVLIESAVVSVAVLITPIELQDRVRGERLLVHWIQEVGGKKMYKQ